MFFFCDISFAMADVRRTSQKVDIDEIWKNIRFTDEEHNPYKFIHCEERNIVLMGRSRTGKSTIAKVMGDVFHFSGEKSLFSETKQIDFHKVTTSTANGRHYYFNIIDVPGFFDISIDIKTSLTNHQVKQFINKCITQNVCNIHMFAYVFNLHGGINEDDIKAMVYTRTHFKDLSANMALIITNCERCTEEQREQLRNNFFKNETVVKHHLKDFFRQGIYFMGCLRQDSYEQANQQSISEEYRNVLEMRNKWILKCIETNTPFNIYHKESRCGLS
jgi:GTP-binding protein EngB required for normal cell division